MSVVSFALNLMSGAMAPLKDLQVFKDYMIELSKNPVLGVFVGTGLTLLIQASSATIGILQNLYAGDLIDLQELCQFYLVTISGQPLQPSLPL